MLPAALTPVDLPSPAVQDLILRHLQDAVFATDLVNVVTFWGRSAERLFGIDAASAVGRPFGELLPFHIAAGTTQDADQEGLLTTIRAGRTWRGEGSVSLPDGRELWIESTVNPIVADGVVVGSVSVGRDMTAQRREKDARAVVERALRESEEEFREAFDYASIGMGLVGLDGRWLKVNRRLVEMLGYSEDELLARTFQDVTHPDDLAADLELVQAILDGRISSFQMEKRYLRGDGNAISVLLAVSLARDGYGRPHHFVAQVVDRSAEVELALEAQTRSVLAESIHAISSNASVEEAAQILCDQVGALPWIDFAAVQAFLGPEDAVVLANWARRPFPTRPGDRLATTRARYLQQRAASGPWAEYTKHDGSDDFALAAEEGLRALAYGPIGNGEPAGVLVLGTSQADFARTLVEKMPGLVALTTTSSALLAERLHEDQRAVALRAAIEREIAERAFHPVFQVIVDLETRAVMGYEALTRFESGTAPDRRFAEAWRSGVGAELELAALGCAVDAASALPAAAWLDLNVSPRLLADSARLRSVLRRADRPVVLEVTEHEVVDDYGHLREALRNLGSDLRVAVDDAGAGVANFGHIIELRPDFVKLDISLVRGVNANLGRQALVVAMRHFARTAGCRLVAEGIETEAEAATLLGLGVEFGQGYLFGRPEPVIREIAGGAPRGRRAARRR